MSPNHCSLEEPVCAEVEVTGITKLRHHYRWPALIHLHCSVLDHGVMWSFSSHGQAIYETFSLKSNNLSLSKWSSDHMIMSVFLFSNLCVWWSCAGWVLGTHCATDCSLTSFVTKEPFVCLFCSCRVTFATSCYKNGESSALLCGEAVALLPITDPASWSSMCTPKCTLSATEARTHKIQCSSLSTARSLHLAIVFG